MSEASSGVPAGGPSSATRIARVALLVAAAGTFLLIAGRAAPYLDQFAGWVKGLGVWGPVVFILGYVIATVAFLPGAPLTVAAGPLFGVARGTAYVFVAATLGACAAFLIARYAARGAIERRLAGNPKFAAVDRAVGAEGRRIVFLLRLSPVFPFNLLNYALGLTRVSFFDHLVASAGMLPGTVLYVYIGKVAGDAAALAGGGAPAGKGVWALRIVGLAATILVTTIITRGARRALKQATGA